MTKEYANSLTPDEIERLRQIWISGASNASITDAFPELNNRNKISGMVYRLRQKGHDFPKRMGNQKGLNWGKGLYSGNVERPSLEKRVAIVKTKAKTDYTLPPKPFVPAVAPKPVPRAPQVARLAVDVPGTRRRFEMTGDSARCALCVWPIGDPRDADFKQCGEPTVTVERVFAGIPSKKPSSYCREHYMKSVAK